MTAPTAATHADPADLPRRIGFWGGSAIMVGVIIGSGIFKSPTDLARQLDSPWTALLFWLMGGLISLCGALTYAELATMFPRSGGVYVFLREGFGRVTAFTFGWTYMILIKPFAAGGIAIVFAEYMNQLTGSDWDPRFTTCTVLIVLTAVNSVHVQVGTGAALLMTSLKVAALLAIIVLAVVGGQGASANFAPVASGMPLYLAIAPAMAAVLWTYDGWSDVGAVAGEVREPQRRLPRIYICGTLLVTALYLAVNAACMSVLPVEEMRQEERIASRVMELLVGPAAATAVTLIVLVSTLGSTHSSIITGARVTFAQARDGLLFRFLGRISPRFGTPIVSLWVQATLSCIAVCALGKFSALIEGFVFVMWIFYGMAAVSVIILRRTRPDAARPFHCPGYPWIPLAFASCAAAMTVLSILADPRTNLAWLGVLLLGPPLYWVWMKAAAMRRPGADAPAD
ncbi:MAG: amino acid permease [Planctomycetia bacterium]|nr:MAG: amino acid permease [Planctomycetia bacterium]